MSISVFDLFSIGIGPSSSHTVGPMCAAKDFVDSLMQSKQVSKVARLCIELYGSLALTGIGHATDTAILNGLEGQDPATVVPSSMIPRRDKIIAQHTIQLGAHTIPFHMPEDFLFFQKEVLPRHTNGMRFSVYDTAGQMISTQVYYSIGGGFILTAEEMDQDRAEDTSLPYPFRTAQELLTLCHKHQLSIDELMFANERHWRDDVAICLGLKNIANIMNCCIDTGCQQSGILPGGLGVKRRAPDLYQKLQKNSGIHSGYEQADIMNRLNMYAMAVNEENAAGGRIVTAPTNGAAGVIPAVLRYAYDAHGKTADEDVYRYFLTAGAIGMLYKMNASISGAEVGCQGEVGAAASMAAGGLTAVLGGSLEQIENAAEIAMEHHLGMTCDPVKALVQIPCIERNAMGAIKAVNAARLALMGNGQHHISLDKVIQTMRQTGKDMNSIYKETSLGGLAVNLPAC